MAESGAVLVVSPSDWLGRRVEKALGRSGPTVAWVPDPKALGRYRRQRPFNVCFVDARTTAGCEAWPARCRKARPLERFVWVLDPWQAVNGSGNAYGYLREPFGSAEVRAWLARALEEERLAKGDRSLEDHLYARFQEFLRELGTSPGVSLHDLVWEQMERPLIASVLEWTEGNQTRAARLLGIHRNTLRAKIRRFGIDPAACKKG
ncbi:helix-turn-helix domain-containing protein [Deferrisoma sp.]